MEKRKEDEMLIDNPSLQEGYQRAIQEMAGEAVDETGKDRPMVEVDRNAPEQEAFTKPYYQQALIQDMNEAAKRQTEADARDFAANRMAGDREMLDYAMENGYDYHFGGPYDWGRPERHGNFWRKNIEDNALPSGDYMQVPDYITGRQRPENIQRQMDEDNREMRALDILEGIEELKRRQAYNT